MIPLEQLLIWNRRGIFPGPDEDERAFCQRVETLEKLLSSYPNQIPLEDWKGSHHFISEVFDVKPDWIVGFYSDQGLPFWQAAATWIENNIPLIQLRKSLSKGSYLGVYDRTEILSHEAIHAVRMAFHEPRFEEVFAYRTSKSAFRRWFGPFFRSSKESYVFCFLLLFSVVTPLIHPFLFWLPWIVVLAGIIRLWRTHDLFKCCIRKLSRFTQKPWAVALRLTDQEIKTIARLSESSLLSVFDQTSLRWKVLQEAYFP